MSLPNFELVRPSSLGAAVEALARFGPEAQMVAGGTDLFPSMKQRLFGPRVLVDLKALRELDYLRFDPQEGLAIGALAKISRLAASRDVAERFPVLAEAARVIASPLLRNMGTVGGNLCLDTRCLYYNQSEFWRGALGGCLKKDGEVCHVAPGGRFCWAVFSGDLAPALMVLGARAILAGPGGTREIPLSEFYVNDGIVRLAKKREEILTGVRVPPTSAGMRGTYKKYRIRRSIDYPLAAVAAAMSVAADGSCLEARVAVTAANPAPKLVPAARDLVGKTFSAELVERVAQEAIRTAKPLRTSSSTPEYRRLMVRVFVGRALRELWLDASRPEHRAVFRAG
jgi:4-hydroxybenzoyl-CoA reductase subunit beta